MALTASVDDFIREQSINWATETLGRCFALRGDEKGYGIASEDAEVASAVQLESELLATRLWGRATDLDERSQTEFGAAAIFDTLVFDLCAQHRRRVTRLAMALPLELAYRTSRN